MRGSDLHFKADTGKVYVRVDGDLIELEDVEWFDPDEFQIALFDMLRRDQIARFEEELELDFAYEVAGLSRFRGNAYQQRGVVQAAFRVIPYEIQSMKDCSFPWRAPISSSGPAVWSWSRARRDRASRRLRRP